MATTARQRSAFELMVALQEADQRPAELNGPLANSILQALGRSDGTLRPDLSIYDLCRNKGLEFIDALTTLRVLRDAGIVEVKTISRMDGRVVLTDAGRRLAYGYAGVTPPPVKAAPPVTPVEVPAATTEPAATPREAALAAIAGSMASFAGIASTRMRGADVPQWMYRRTLSALLDYSDQPLQRLSKNTGAGMVETAETVRVLRDAGLVVLASSMSDQRARLTDDGRVLAKALRAMETPPAPEAPGVS